MTSIKKNVSEQDMNDVIWEMSIPTGLEVMKSIGHNDFISTKDNSNDGETKSGATKILLGDLKAGETKYVTIELGSTRTSRRNKYCFKSKCKKCTRALF